MSTISKWSSSSDSTVLIVARLLFALLSVSVIAACSGSQAAVVQPAATATAIPPTATATALPTEQPPTSTATAMAMATATPLVSVDGGMSATLTLSNSSERNIAIYWIDLDGVEQFTKRLTPGQAYAQPTFVGHIWRVRDEASDEIIKDIEIKSREPNVVILIPNAVALGPTLVPTATPTPALVTEINGCIVADSGTTFFSKYCDADGISILASEEVQDKAVQQAWWIITNMLSSRPDIHEHFSNIQAKFIVIGVNQETSDIPQYYDLRLGDTAFWNRRARGFGGTKTNPTTSSAEENLLCWANDGWYGYNVSVHEFAHTIHLVGLDAVEPEIHNRIDAAFKEAKESGKWQNAYAGSNQQEYWAEGVTMYFNAYGWNLASNDYVNTRQELKEYDPALFAVIDDVFRGLEWTPVCP